MSKRTKYEEHTPGPWHFGDDGVPGRPSPTLIYAPGGEIVAEARYGFHRPGERWANATLIADAPALLACALELREALEVFWHKAGSPLRIGVPDKGFLSAMDVLNRFDALTGVSAARVAGKGGGKP